MHTTHGIHSRTTQNNRHTLRAIPYHKKNTALSRPQISHWTCLYLLISRGTCRRFFSGPWTWRSQEPQYRRHVPLVPVGALHLGDGDFAAVIAFASFRRLFHFLGFLFGDGEVGMDLYVSHLDTDCSNSGPGLNCVRWVNQLGDPGVFLENDMERGAGCNTVSRFGLKAYRRTARRKYIKFFTGFITGHLSQIPDTFRIHDSVSGHRNRRWPRNSLQEQKRSCNERCSHNGIASAKTHIVSGINTNCLLRLFLYVRLLLL